MTLAVAQSNYFITISLIAYPRKVLLLHTQYLVEPLYSSHNQLQYVSYVSLMCVQLAPTRRVEHPVIKQGKPSQKALSTFFIILV